MTVKERISFSARVVISYALYYSGLLHLAVRLRLRRKVVVLAYHRVLTPAQRSTTASQEGMVVEDATFARHLEVLARQFRVLTLDEFARHLDRREPFDGPCCLITFDDGWVDNFENALPMLQSHALPAVMFLPVNFIGERRSFTRETLTHLLVRAVELGRRDPAARDALRAQLAPLGLDCVLDATDVDPLPAALSAIGRHRYAGGPEFEALVATLSSELDVAGVELSDLDAFVDWGKVAQLERSGFTFGGHGADHRVLTQVTSAVAACEAETSKKVLDGRLARPVYAFAYPNGAWNAEVVRTVKAAGYRIAFTIDQGHVSCDDDHFTLRRVNMHDGMTRSKPMFMARLAGIF